MTQGNGAIGKKVNSHVKEVREYGRMASVKCQSKEKAICHIHLPIAFFVNDQLHFDW